MSLSFHRFRRHPFPFEANFEWSLALVYAYPEEALKPFLTPGLELDTHDGFGFIAVALVQTRDLRPRGWPSAFGRDFFLGGLRVFTRYTNSKGRRLRGLRILGGYANSRFMVTAGSLTSHYQYRYLKVDAGVTGTKLHIESGDDVFSLSTDFTREVALPADSVFPDLKTARLFAGPMPFTFDYEKETHSMISVEGKRANWKPQPVAVDIRSMKPISEGPLAGLPAPRLSNCFLVRDVDYSWGSGVVEKLE